MDKFTVRFAIAAAVIAAVALGLFELITPCQFGVVQAQEKKAKKDNKAEEKKKESCQGWHASDKPRTIPCRECPSR